jgi:predicted ATPase
MLIRSIKLNNFLSFGPDAKAIELGPLNVVIGPNGSGKSNLLEAISLLKAAPTDFQRPISEGGGISEWLWKGRGSLYTAVIGATIGDWVSIDYFIYNLMLAEIERRPYVSYESANYEFYDHDNKKTVTSNLYVFNGDVSIIMSAGAERALIKIDNKKSILAQIKDPEAYSELNDLGDFFSQIRLYRDWRFGRNTPARLPQRADMPNDMLEEDASNLGLVLNFLRRDFEAKQRLLKALGQLYQGIDDFDIRVEGGTVQVFLLEGRSYIPATRLSDGTLRYLCLLAILCHPKPPPLVCIEEPELGLHPDILPGLADLLKEASTRCQIIVTTHSEVLVDAMTDMPEAVLVAEKHEGGTEIKRLDPDEMKPWLEKYRLGQLWTRGDIGGNRW